LNRRKKAAYVAPVGAKGFEFIVRADLDTKALGQELRRLRENCLVSVTDLAERMGWNRQNIHRLERGGPGREPTISSVNLYVRMLGFELVLGAKPKKQPRRASEPAQESPGGKE
jgi:transcriptional regulator with XRE-family HTH domain